MRVPDHVLTDCLLATEDRESTETSMWNLKALCRIGKPHVEADGLSTDKENAELGGDLTAIGLPRTCLGEILHIRTPYDNQYITD